MIWSNSLFLVLGSIFCFPHGTIWRQLSTSLQKLYPVFHRHKENVWLQSPDNKHRFFLLQYCYCLGRERKRENITLPPGSFPDGIKISTCLNPPQAFLPQGVVPTPCTCSGRSHWGWISSLFSAPQFLSDLAWGGLYIPSLHHYLQKQNMRHTLNLFCKTEPHCNQERPRKHTCRWRCT